MAISRFLRLIVDFWFGGFLWRGLQPIARFMFGSGLGYGRGDTVLIFVVAPLVFIFGYRTLYLLFQLLDVPYLRVFAIDNFICGFVLGYAFQAGREKRSALVAILVGCAWVVGQVIDSYLASTFFGYPHPNHTARRLLLHFDKLGIGLALGFLMIGRFTEKRTKYIACIAATWVLISVIQVVLLMVLINVLSLSSLPRWCFWILYWVLFVAAIRSTVFFQRLSRQSMNA